MSSGKKSTGCLRFMARHTLSEYSSNKYSPLHRVHATLCFGALSRGRSPAVCPKCFMVFGAGHPSLKLLLPDAPGCPQCPRSLGTMPETKRRLYCYAFQEHLHSRFEEKWSQNIFLFSAVGVDVLAKHRT